MKRLLVSIVTVMMAMTSFAQAKNDTTYVTMDFNQNPWNYPVREVTKGWSPDMKDWDTPGAFLDDADFSWPVNGGAPIKVTLYGVDLDEYERVPVYGHVTINDAEASSWGMKGVEAVNILYTCQGATMRFEAPEGYKFGKMVFYCYRSNNILVGDEYDEEFKYIYNDTEFTQKLKVWTPTSPKKNQYDYDMWEGDEKNILFKYNFFSAHFVKIEIRLVPDGTAQPVVAGDANGDGVVDVDDVVAIVNYILGEPSDNFHLDAADVNGDQVIDVSDVVGVVNIILGDA
jgi:hypothetical protein